MVCDNFHFVPPDDFLRPDQPAREVDRLLSSIIGAERGRQALEQASRYWSATFDAMNDMVCLLTRDGTVLRCNGTMANLLGLGTDELSGRSATRSCTARAPSSKSVRIRRCSDREARELRAASGRHWYQVSADPLFGEAQEIVGAVHIVRDITETKTAREALAEESRWLAAINALALELATMPSDADPGALLATRLRETTGAAAVGFGIYDRRDRSVGPPQISFAPGVLELLSRPLRRRLAALRTVIDDDLLTERT